MIPNAENDMQSWPAKQELLPKVTFKFWESEFVPNLNFTQTSTHNIVYGPHLHSALEIVWIGQGESEIYCGERLYRVCAGEAFVIAPNTVHASDLSSSWSSFTTLHIPEEILRLVLEMEDLRTLGVLAANPVRLLTGATAPNLYQALIRTLPRINSLHGQMACLHDSLVTLFRSGANPAARDPYAHPAVSQALSTINSGFTETIDLCGLATEFKLHPRYFSSLFKSRIGIPPHQYQIALRIDLVRRMLNTMTPLSDLALQTGFSDQSHLNRHFKRIYGMPPGVIREQTSLLNIAS